MYTVPGTCIAKVKRKVGLGMRLGCDVHGPVLPDTSSPVPAETPPKTSHHLDFHHRGLQSPGGGGWGEGMGGRGGRGRQIINRLVTSGLLSKSCTCMRPSLSAHQVV